MTSAPLLRFLGVVYEIKLNGFPSVFQNGLNNGGPAGLIYGFLFTWVGSGFQALVMAEMASMSVIDVHTFAKHAK